MSKITLSANIKLNSENNVLKSFFIQSQYEYESKEYRTTTDSNIEKEDLGVICFHYQVELEDEIYWVPGIYCVEYDGEIGIYNKKGQYFEGEVTDELLHNKGEYERQKFSNENAAPDVEKQTEEMLGRRITNRYVPDVDRDYLRKLLEAKNPINHKP